MLLRRWDDGANAPYERELLAGALRILGEHAFETHRRRVQEAREAFLRLSEHFCDSLQGLAERLDIQRF